MPRNTRDKQSEPPRASRREFVELDRRFVPFDDEETELTPAYLETGEADNEIKWRDLLAKPLVVIVAEAGSGKSWEMERQVECLQQAHTPAFKLDLKALVDHPLDFAFSERERALYRRWHARATGYFFLDSVDEAKLQRHADFYLALKHFANALGSARARAVVVIGTRPNAWLPQRDKAEVLRFLSVNDVTAEVATSEQQDETFITAPTGKRELSGICVVRMQPLDRERVARFAAAQIGQVGAQKFAAALDESRAWEFARRPYDVQQFLRFWKREGRLGTLTELIQFVVTEGLEEHEPSRSEALSVSRAREGAQWLAAQTRFARIEDLAASEQDRSDGRESAELTTRDCLPPDWKPGERDALLARPLFEPAAYGFVRFHHRRTAEYLAAEWVETWVERGASIEALRDLLFARVLSMWQVRAALTPVVAWLAGSKMPEAQMLRQWILQCAPWIHLAYGDPATLPISYRRALLRRLVEHYQGRRYVDVEWEAESLARLGSPDLAPDISQWLIDDAVSEGLRCDYLMLVRHAKLRDCLPAALCVLRSSASSDTLKRYALATLRDVGDLPERQALAEVVKHWTDIPSGLIGHLTEALYPDVWTPAQLTDALCRSEPPPPNAVSAEYTIRSHLEHALQPHQALGLLPLLQEVVTREPHAERSRVSTQYGWMCAFLPPLVEQSLDARTATDESTQTIVNALLLLDALAEEDARIGHLHLDKEAKDRFNSLLNSHPALKLRYLLAVAKQVTDEYGQCQPWQIQFAARRSVVDLGWRDVVWLLSAQSLPSGHRSPRLALECAAEWLWQAPTLTQRFELLSRVVGHALIHGKLSIAVHALILPAQSAVRRWWVKSMRYGILQDHWWRERGRQLQRLRNALRDTWVLHRRVALLSSAKRIDWLGGLAREAMTDHSRWSETDWAVLTKKRGRFIAGAVQHGCETSWRRYTPVLPHEKSVRNQTSTKVVVGLVGLQSEYARKGAELFAGLPRHEAELACRYACNELNGFPGWIGELAQAQPAACAAVFGEAVLGEWAAAATEEFAGDVASRLRYAEEPLCDLVKEVVRTGLYGSDPPNTRMLDHVLHLAVRAEAYTRAEWAQLSASKVKPYSPDTDPFMLWIGMWLQSDLAGALAALESLIGSLKPPEQDALVMRLLRVIGSRSRLGQSVPRIRPENSWSPAELERLIVFVYTYVRPADDIEHHDGVYTPTARDDAQHARGELVTLLAQHPDPEALRSLERLMKEPALAPHRDWLLNLSDRMGPRLADGPPKAPADIHALYRSYVAEPHSDRELFAVALHRLSDVKFQLEESENSPRHEAQKTWNEHAFQFWLMRKLEERSRGHYALVAEAETDDGFADMRFVHSATNSAVPVEMKWAESWTYIQLLDALRDQLTGQYLRPRNRRHGVLVIGYIGNQKTWHSPDRAFRWTFDEVAQQLRAEASKLVGETSGVEALEVVSLDFTEP